MDVTMAGGPEDGVRQRAETVTLLIEQFRNNDITMRINAFKQLPFISQALGPRRTREELIPYVTNEFVDDEDDVILTICEELPKLKPHIGGDSFSYVLLPPLETLASSEEPAVREKAVAAVEIIISTQSSEHIIKYTLPFLRRLATRGGNDRGQSPVARLCACKMFHTVYPRLDTALQAELRAMYLVLCADPTSVVRRAACESLQYFFGVLDTQHIQKQFYQPLLALASDQEDSVRLYSVHACVKLAAVCQASGEASRVLSVVHALCKDKSWRVRYMMADRFAELFAAVIGPHDSKEKDSGGSSNTQDAEGKRSKVVKAHAEPLLEAFNRLVTDAEPEVRTAAAFKLGLVGKLAGADATVTSLMRGAAQLANDPSAYCRGALATNFLELAGALTTKQIAEHVIPLFLKFLEDSDSDVRLNAINKLDLVIEVMGVDLVAKSVIPVLHSLASDANWRVRAALIEHVPQIAKQLGRPLFVSQLLLHCIHWLKDRVFVIRVAATANLVALASLFGPGWTVDFLIPHVVGLAEEPSYMHRLTCLYCLKALSPELGQQVCAAVVFPLLAKLAADPVPNIRFNVSRVASAVHTLLPPQQRRLLPPLLHKLEDDDDRDVSFWAGKALAVVLAMDLG